MSVPGILGKVDAGHPGARVRSNVVHDRTRTAEGLAALVVGEVARDERGRVLREVSGCTGTRDCTEGAEGREYGR